MGQLPDESTERREWLPLVVLVGLAIGLKIPTLSTPAFWDEIAWLGQAGWLANEGLVRVVPGLRPDAQFFGHPPGLQFMAAALFRVFGQSIEVAHFLIAVLGAIGVTATYALVRRTHDARTALLAALLLLLSPAWFSHAGMFLGDLPVAALGVLSAVLVMRGRLLAYFLAASTMVLVKETAVSLVVALTVFRLLQVGGFSRVAMRDALRYASPLLVFLAFIVVQKIATGHFFYIYDFEAEPLFELNVANVLRQAASITHWMLLAQFRWALTLAIVVDVAVNRNLRDRPDLWLFALVALMSGYAFSVLFYAERYVLPVLPFLYASGAVSLMSLARRRPWQDVVALAAAAVSIWTLALDPYRGHGEDNMAYRRVVETHQVVAAELANRYAGARIVSAWPTAAELSQPLAGYVDAPLNVKWYRSEADLSAADIVVVSSPANPEAVALEDAVRRAGWVSILSERYGPTAITAYQRPR